MKGLPKELVDRCEWKTVKHEEAAPPTIKTIHYEPTPCEDCGLTVTDRRLDIRLRRDNPGQFYGNFTKHWGICCRNCDMMRDPETGKFTIPKSEYSAIIKARYRNRDK